MKEDNLANDAKRMSLLFDYGVATIDDIVAWADAMILQTETPPDPLFDLAFARTRNAGEVMSALNTLSAGADFWTALRLTLPTLRRYIIANPSMAGLVASLLERSIGRYPPSDVPKEFNFICRFDNAFYLAQDGSYGNVESVYDEFIQELSRFDPDG